MKRFFIDLALILVFFVLQTTIFPMLKISSIIPNILIILVSCSGFMQGDREGMFVGFACGLLLDVCSFDIFGFYTILYMLIGFLNGLLHNFFYLKDFKLPAIMIVSSDLVCCFATYFFLFLLRSRFEFGFYFLNIILPEVVYTLLISVIIYPLLWVIEAYVFKKKNAESS
ncbi:rod shape-determining protein MreD [Lachnospiraceae bacterium G41]|nr:rod shape-determining protein MreD [Lachnospiraceae bacterium G41]